MAKQGQLEGMETKKDKALSEAFGEYVEATSEYATQRHIVVEKREAVLALMKDRGIKEYADRELGKKMEINVTPAKRTIKVKDLKTQAEGEVDAEEEDEEAA